MITHICSFLPPSKLTNGELSQLFPDWTPEKILEKTGIKERRIVSSGVCASDLAFMAAKQLIKIGGKEADFLLFCTQTPDYLLPTTACILQHRLGLSNACAALDFNLGCSGYIYGLALSTSLLESGAAQRVLLLTGDTYTKLIHPLDRGTRTIFGDAGTATLIAKSANARLHSFVLGSDGSGAEELMVKSSGIRFPRINGRPANVNDSGNVNDPEWLHMNGPEIFNFTLRTVPGLVREVLAKANLSLAEVDLVVFHQANAFMLEHLRRKLEIPNEKFVLHLEYCGNTVSSTIPLALEHVISSGRLQPGMKVLLVGFGVGYSWGGCILEW